MPRGRITRPSLGATKGPMKHEESEQSQKDSTSSSSEDETLGIPRGKRPSETTKPRRELPARTPAKPQGALHRPARNPHQDTLSPIVVSPAESDVSPGPADGNEYPFSSPTCTDADSKQEEIGALTPLTPPEIGRHTRRVAPVYDDSPLPRTVRLRATEAKYTSTFIKSEPESYLDDDDHETRPKISRRLFTEARASELGSGKDSTKANSKSKSTSDKRDTQTERQETGLSGKLRDLADSPSVRGPVRNWFGHPLGFVIPFDVHVRYSEDSGKCVASKVKKPFGRCGQPRRANLKDRFLSLLNCFKHYEAGKHVDLCDLLEAFVKEAFCPQHYKSAKKRLTAHVKRYLKVLTGDSEHTSQEANSSEADPLFTKLDFEQWLHALSKTVLADPTIEIIAIVKSDVSPADRIKYSTPSRQGSLSLKVVGAYKKKCDAAKSTAEVVFGTIWKVLCPEAQENGYIYVLTHHSDTRYRKIGYTRGAPEKRRMQWDNCCGRHHGYQQLPGNGQVLHAFRVEQIIQAELKDVRRLVECSRCQKKHGEWFEVTETHLDKVFQKWKDWISEKPYTQVVENIWSLKAESILTLRAACEPIPVGRKMGPPKVRNRTIKVEGGSEMHPIKE
ncbi:hypothetical protein K491DRAFT_731493 [Lophiostoma macrostomum CBS 122681]|uniref:Bacteriophage T5 Orf172 DNA-binding domain-containing protein n=1 Tax=Lophiostoma macrostomum CBS 122681 TaxID=1314788 RepID=A0A6A6TKL5_9PLEO|nr:hypothetical protein K491DRAFT_731493 [Lophiostoma macrostomum CBS 122681]